MIFVRKRTKCKNNRWIKLQSLEEKKKKLLQVVTSLVDCFTSCDAPTAPVWYTDRLCATCGVTSGTPQSPPFSCTSHAYRKRNKVYTQWCLCYIYFFLIFFNTFTPGKWFSGGSFQSCERGVLGLSCCALISIRDWHFGSQAARTWLMVSVSVWAAASLFGEGVAGLHGPISACCRRI